LKNPKIQIENCLLKRCVAEFSERQAWPCNNYGAPSPTPMADREPCSAWGSSQTHAVGPAACAPATAAFRWLCSCHAASCSVRGRAAGCKAPAGGGPSRERQACFLPTSGRAAAADVAAARSAAAQGEAASRGGLEED
jgi:hypothetical protein